MRVEGQSSLYGMQLDTVNSLILSILPPVGFKFECQNDSGLFDTTEDIKIHILRLLVQCLRECCGMHIPYVSVYSCYYIHACKSCTYVYTGESELEQYFTHVMLHDDYPVVHSFNLQQDENMHK